MNIYELGVKVEDDPEWDLAPENDPLLIMAAKARPICRKPKGHDKPLHDNPKDNENCDGHCAANECVCPEGGWANEADRLLEQNKRLQATIAFLDKKLDRMRVFVFCPFCGVRLTVVFSAHICGISDID
jgi:hypothetical protein